jgi:phosphohistidine phosphatase
MEVYFFRHGEAEPAAPGGSDESRRLTDRGKRDVQAVGERLQAAGVKPGAILTSPLVRARQTGEILQQVFGVTAQADERLRSGATLGSLQILLSDCSKERVMLVGHEPDLSTIVGQLTGGHVKLSTSGVARVDVETFEPGHGMLMWLLSPGLLAAD